MIRRLAECKDLCPKNRLFSPNYTNIAFAGKIGGTYIDFYYIICYTWSKIERNRDEL